MSARQDVNHLEHDNFSKVEIILGEAFCLARKTPAIGRTIDVQYDRL